MKEYTVFLKSGQTVHFKAESFEVFTNNGECSKWTVTGAKPIVWFDPSQISAFAVQS